MKAINIKMLMPITITVDAPDEIVELLQKHWQDLSAQDHHKIGTFLSTLPHHADIDHFEIDGRYYSA